MPGKLASPPSNEPRARGSNLSRHHGIAVRRRCQHGEDKNGSLGDRGVIGGDVQQQQDVDDNHQNKGAEHRRNWAAEAAAEARSADNDGGKNRQQQRIADKRIAGSGLGGDKDPGEAIATSGQDVDQ